MKLIITLLSNCIIMIRFIHKICKTVLFAALFLLSTNSFAQVKNDSIMESALNGLKFRNIGPAVMSGRIADIAIDQHNPSTWFVAVGSGGVWKTTNSGNTWKPIFDDKPSFSIGCVTIDPSNSATIWVGTGENVGGRHVGFGDGIYKSNDGGNSFTKMGLDKSEHISKIVVHPKNSDVIWVASQGPLWSKGGERGIYKSVDGGKTWKQTLGDKEWIGATDIVINPENPQILYAATWQRHRTIAAYMGGGPGTAIYKSKDGGDTWEKLTNGLPTSNMGKIGLAISPQKPDVVYAAIELERRTGGVFRSSNGGANWTKMSDAVSGATGPHYYQELYASPHQFDHLYLMDMRIQVSSDGGKTFTRLKEEHKHSDNHAIAFIKDRPDYLLIGTDGGLYESFDNAENWKFFANLPITQFYDIAIDDSEPFYNIYGGTQDNSTQGGPSQTDKIQGIHNSDWKVVLDWDGQQPAVEPGNPNIIYAQRQEGTLARIDMVTGEVTDIQPSPAAGETFERYNWDAPILVSNHNPTTIYFASQRLWKSEDRGDTWTAISSDLTKNQNRMNLPIMGSTQGFDNAWDMLAMSNFNTITMIDESPLNRDLIYVGTDDGLIQITEDGGKTWRKMEASSLPGCPASAYINEIKADLFDVNTAYITLDNYKTGDYNPYIYKTNDKGKTWKSMKGNFPERNFIWRLVQDHINPKLIFAASEFGMYVTLDGGEKWMKLNGGMPMIACRDIKIHKKEDDLVVATFGRGIYILDDISPLRNMDKNALAKDFKLFDTPKANWFIPRSHLGFEPGKGDQGAGFYTADNPTFGASFTYLINKDVKTLKEKRKANEKINLDKKVPVSFPDWDQLHQEETEGKLSIAFVIKDQKGQYIRTVNGPVGKGIHRIYWDLRHVDASSILAGDSEKSSMLAMPGKYTASMYLDSSGILTDLGQSTSFEVVPLRKNSIQKASYADVAGFWRQLENTAMELTGLQIKHNLLKSFGQKINKAMHTYSGWNSNDLNTMSNLLNQLDKVNITMNGLPIKDQIGEKNNPTVGSRLFNITRGVAASTYGPTNTNKKDLNILQDMIKQNNTSLEQIEKSLDVLANKIAGSGGPKLMKGN